MKAISLSWLAKTDLANFNAGENVGNLTELKLYGANRKPYISGQAMRSALFETLQRSFLENFLCSPETPCGDVEHCWSCDLRGFLATKEETGGDRRWSPIKMSVALGQMPANIVNDLLTRHSELEKAGRASKDHRIAHVQMTENIYRCSLVVDVANVGRVTAPKTEVIESKSKGKGKDKKSVKTVIRGYEACVEVDREEKINRMHAILDAVYNLSGLAKQARAASSVAPEVMLLSLQNHYNQRGLNASDLNESGEIELDRLQVILKEHRILNNQLIVGWTPGIVANEKETLKLLQENEVPVMSVLEGLLWAKSQVSELE